MALVEAHLDRLAEDGRAPATQATYKVVAGKLRAKLGGVRVREATPARIDAALRSMSNTHGPVMARQAKTILSGGLQLAVMANVLSTNPVRDVQQIKSKRPPKGAPALTAEGLRALLAKLRASEYCREHDLVDPFTLLIATGLRRGELLALRWSDFDETSGTLAVAGKVVRITGRGLTRMNETKSAAGRRTIALPSFAIKCLRQRRTLPYLGEHPVIKFRLRRERGVTRVTSAATGASCARTWECRKSPHTASARHSRRSLTTGAYPRVSGPTISGIPRCR
jgi:integrase